MPTLSPTTLTRGEQRLILRVAAENIRDHTIFSFALGTGLRLGEIVGLNVGDVCNGNGRPRTRIRIRAEITKGGRAGDVFLPDRLVAKLRKFRNYKKQKRRVQYAWRQWQQRAGFDRLYNFHSIRHSSITNVYRSTHDLFLAQRFARHVSPLTTTVYTHPSDEDMRRHLRPLNC
jgi:integrase